jgi:hypothetical protein
MEIIRFLRACNRREMVSGPIPVKLNGAILLVVTLLIGGVIGFTIARGGVLAEGFATSGPAPLCTKCNKGSGACGCGAASRLICPPCPSPDLSKYVLKSSVPPCPTVPDLSNYMLKTECPPVPDLSKYVLKSSIPRQQPVIIDNSSCKDGAGACPPCPRPRCPEVKCPPAPACPTCAPCPRPVCPPQQVKCTATDTTQSTVRPFLAPLNFATFGGA